MSVGDRLGQTPIRLIGRYGSLLYSYRAEGKTKNALGDLVSNIPVNTSITGFLAENLQEFIASSDWIEGTTDVFLMIPNLAITVKVADKIVKGSVTFQILGSTAVTVNDTVEYYRLMLKRN